MNKLTMTISADGNTAVYSGYSKDMLKEMHKSTIRDYCKYDPKTKTWNLLLNAPYGVNSKMANLVRYAEEFYGVEIIRETAKDTKVAELKKFRRMTKSNLMKRAWAVAREYAVKLGIKVKDALSQALKDAWAEVKEINAMVIAGTAVFAD